jgi:FkbM family methyltransferase
MSGRRIRAALGIVDLSANPVEGLAFLLSCKIPALRQRFVGDFRLSGLRFSARPADANALTEVLVAREYACVDQVLGQLEAPTIVDIGANIGMFSLFCLSRRRQADVLAVEPAPATFRLLRRNAGRNPSLKWRTLRYALWSRDGEVGFEGREHSTSSRVSPSGGEVTAAITLETLCSRHVGSDVDLMKVDIEGAEEAVICGHERVLQRVANLVVELHPSLCRHDRVVASLRGAYQFLYRIPGRRSSKPLLLASRSRRPLPEYRPS